ncbi:transposase family protein [Streptomyces sp. NPDC005803]|uniref:transposase family protein n=1 Tax=Streptomyces sp. NPDC005803 TaxID=3154297 RepID=UPI0033CB34A3
MTGAICPGCGSWLWRIHSSYLRFPAHVPRGGRRVALCLRVRRFLCPVISCGRRTSASSTGTSTPTSPPGTARATWPS